MFAEMTLAELQLHVRKGLDPKAGNAANAVQLKANLEEMAPEVEEAMNEIYGVTQLLRKNNDDREEAIKAIARSGKDHVAKREATAIVEAEWNRDRIGLEAKKADLQEKYKAMFDIYETGKRMLARVEGK